MFTTTDLLAQLSYLDSPHHKFINDVSRVETAHLFRAAAEAKVQSIYLIETSSEASGEILPPRPVVYIAEAETAPEAREIHRSLWNLNYVPFLIVKLPDQIRVYTGFEYSPTDKQEGLVDTVPSSQFENVASLLADISAASINSGYIWQSAYSKKLNPNNRVDKSLLKNLKQLGNELKNDLPKDIAHSLIGKYVYISYLRGRGILSNAWLTSHNIVPDSIFTLEADIDSFQRLIVALEQRFNGKIFPIDFASAIEDGLTDSHISWVASIFSGSEIVDSAPGMIQQLHLPFQAYDFRYIPVETFSAIYEQFIDQRKKKGAIYTPEFLADYLLSEIESQKPLEIGNKLCDPACGSGVFLVLAYRRLIEKERQKLGRELNPNELGEILETSIYGVEREQDACYVAEFSLILTLLHYVDPPDLDKLQFKFPDLHNKQIFHMDFFDVEGKETAAGIWQQNLRFDFVVGNPPWSKRLDPQHDEFAREWIKSARYPTARWDTAQAFSWLSMELLNANGIVGLLLPATGLFTGKSKDYRASFFRRNKIHRVTNFANLRTHLFGAGRGSIPPSATMIYQPAEEEAILTNHIVHYAPFVINQQLQKYKQPWTVTINENEISIIRQQDVIDGNSFAWKLALWGNFADKDVLERITNHFSTRLSAFCQLNQWSFQEATQLRNEDANEKIELVTELEGEKQLIREGIEKSLYRFSIASNALQHIPNTQCYIREGRRQGLKTTYAPHLLIAPRARSYVIDIIPIKYSSLERRNVF